MVSCDGVFQFPNNVPLRSDGHGIPAIGVGRRPVAVAIMMFGGEHQISAMEKFCKSYFFLISFAYRNHSNMQGKRVLIHMPTN